MAKVAPYKVILAGLGLAVVCFYGGRWTANPACEAAVAAAELIWNAKQQKLINAVQNEDDKALGAAQAKLKELEDERNAIASKVSGGTALSKSDVDRLRKYFTDTQRPAK